MADEQTSWWNIFCQCTKSIKAVLLTEQLLFTKYNDNHAEYCASHSPLVFHTKMTNSSLCLISSTNLLKVSSKTTLLIGWNYIWSMNMAVSMPNEILDNINQYVLSCALFLQVL